MGFWIAAAVVVVMVVALAARANHQRRGTDASTPTLGRQRTYEADVSLRGKPRR